MSTEHTKMVNLYAICCFLQVVQQVQ